MTEPEVKESQLMRFTCRDGSEPALSAARQSLARQPDPVAAGSGIGVPNKACRASAARPGPRPGPTQTRDPHGSPRPCRTECEESIGAFEPFQHPSRNFLSGWNVVPG